MIRPVPRIEPLTHRPPRPWTPPKHWLDSVTEAALIEARRRRKALPVDEQKQPLPPACRVGSGRVGSGRVGSGRVGSGRVGSGRVGSGRVGSGRVGREDDAKGET